ncbi:rhomboid family intramembrane serine protease [Cohnella sp. WQ 127256]|uniref:rhomboid family intramembrane serine protease n=1 Tax=Cohnella sp. WQ 127256 TaxID=2938790 RepID=UPI0021173E0A|nr:rhomboid family intramembrane serine protease [Cohnella sp. WQ 127256]
MLFLRNETFRGYIRMYPITTLILIINLLIMITDTLIMNDELTIRGMFYIEPVFNRYGLSEPWRYITSIFLHAGWEHLLFNSFSILVFAPPLERILGHFRYVFFYLAAGVAGNILTTVVQAGSEYGSVGASGAIYGVFGAFLYLAVFRMSSLDDATRKTIFSLILFGLVYSFIAPNINIWAHLGGAIAGFAMMSLVALRKK